MDYNPWSPIDWTIKICPMVHLCRYTLPDNKLKKIFDLFSKVVGERDDKKDFENVITDLISPPERIMIAKRLAIIYLIQKNIEVCNICTVLKVSKSTVYKFAYYVKNKNRAVVKILRQKVLGEKLIDLFKDLHDSLYATPGVYGNNWKNSWENKIQREKEKTFGI